MFPASPKSRENGISASRYSDNVWELGKGGGIQDHLIIQSLEEVRIESEHYPGGNF
jgi:hypothetical protein